LRLGTGRAGVVFFDGVRTNARLEYTRKFLLERFELLVIVSLLVPAFALYGGWGVLVVFWRPGYLSTSRP